MLWMAPYRWTTKIVGMNSRRYSLVLIDFSTLLGVGIASFGLEAHFNLGLVLVALGGIYIMIGLERFASGITL